MINLIGRKTPAPELAGAVPFSVLDFIIYVFSLLPGRVLYLLIIPVIIYGIVCLSGWMWRSHKSGCLCVIHFSKEIMSVSTLIFEVLFVCLYVFHLFCFFAFASPYM